MDLAGKKTAFFAFTGLIESNSATRIASAMNMAANQGCDEVYLCISSHGGLVADGIFLYNHIMGLPLTVIAHNVGSISSIAAAVYVAADTRHCSAHAMFMIHPTAMHSTENMSAERLQASLDAALADDHRTENILRERTSLPDDILTARRFKDVYIPPERAVEVGLAHTVCEFTLPTGNEILQI